LSENPEIAKVIKITFIGRTWYTNEMAEKLGFADKIECLDQMDHEMVYQHMANADVLLLIVGEVKRNDRIATSKLFEYIASGNQVLAIVPPNGIAADIIRETGTGIVAYSNDGIKTGLLALYNKWKDGKTAVDRNEIEIKKYSVINKAKEFSEIFDELTQE
jgi:glycosyltransferase involved in cell wall biosynthesis